MSANADVLRSFDLPVWPVVEEELAESVVGEASRWSPQDYAREQILGLVRQVFLAGALQPSKQVVFSAAEAETDVAKICEQVALTLALEASADVAIVGREQRLGEKGRSHPRSRRHGTIKSWSAQMTNNLWRVPGSARFEYYEEGGTGRSWLSFLAELRNEFEYAVINAPVAGVSSEAGLTGKLADGLILVVGAHRTRKATARTIKNRLESLQCRILGTVLSERTFPVPERIYRRL
jgi:hypothetical protein